ncbi:hypothetical protein [Isorropodon fossajaponicum symbiont]|uniref:hypothetical protein n=1 Tax=Isorropodon fossajaponicum symbiont TaxID=883811 RepID=UPI001CEC19CB|nr:hypothetical protein [Isorropodon fossajaponicum symbiont]
MTKEFSKLFNETFNLKTNPILGTLSEPVKNEYDLILTNPPYVTSGSSNLKEEITYKKFLISDIFYIQRGNGKYTKNYAHVNQGSYPLFSGNTSGIFAKKDF